MSQLRLHVIVSHLFQRKYDAHARRTTEESTSTWNPPAWTQYIVGGEKVTVRPLKYSDLENTISLIKKRNVLDFPESEISCAIQCPQYRGVVAESEDGSIIGCWHFMVYSSKVSASGQAYVDTVYRKKGIAKAMEQYGIGNGPNDGDAQVFSYGFEENLHFYKNMNCFLDDRYGSFLKVAGTFTSFFFNIAGDGDIAVKELMKDDLQTLCEYDLSVHKLDRSAYIRAICCHHTSRTFLAFRDGEICGYGVLRKCFRSHKIAPLFADSSTVARSLYKKLGRAAPADCLISMTVPTRNASATAIMEENDFKLIKKMLRLQLAYTTSKHGVGIIYNRVYSLTDANFSLC